MERDFRFALYLAKQYDDDDLLEDDCNDYTDILMNLSESVGTNIEYRSETPETAFNQAVIYALGMIGKKLEDVSARVDLTDGESIEFQKQLDNALLVYLDIVAFDNALQNDWNRSFIELKNKLFITK